MSEVRKAYAEQLKKEARHKTIAKAVSDIRRAFSPPPDPVLPNAPTEANEVAVTGVTPNLKEKPLPPGWTEEESKTEGGDDFGRMYYFHKATKTTSWKKPASDSEAAEIIRSSATAAPPGWTAHMSSKLGGKIYYYNKETKETVWNLPENAPTAPSDGPNPHTTTLAEEAKKVVEAEAAHKAAASDSSPLMTRAQEREAWKCMDRKYQERHLGKRNYGLDRGRRLASGRLSAAGVLASRPKPRAPPVLERL